MGIWTQADVDTMKAAVAQGILQVRFDGPPARQVTYQSLEQMRATLAEMVASVAASSGSGVSRRLATYRKGL